MAVSPIARGGRRQGTPGKGYSNRTDLLQNYAAPAAPQAGSAQSAQPQQAAPAAGPPAPGTLGTFLPSQRPSEPITHGLPTGPGGGPEVLQQPFTVDPAVQAAAALSAVPVAHQTPMMRALAAATQASVRNVSNPGVAAGGQ